MQSPSSPWDCCSIVGATCKWQQHSSVGYSWKWWGMPVQCTSVSHNAHLSANRFNWNVESCSVACLSNLKHIRDIYFSVHTVSCLLPFTSLVVVSLSREVTVFSMVIFSQLLKNDLLSVLRNRVNCMNVLFVGSVFVSLFACLISEIIEFISIKFGIAVV